MVRPERLRSDAAPVVLVTGARMGIGRATAVAFGEAGMRVALSSRAAAGLDQEPLGGSLEEACAEVEAAGGAAFGVGLDLADRASVDRMLDAIAARWGPVDILVNNALCDQRAAQQLIEVMDFDAYETMIVGEVVNATYLTRQVLAQDPRRQVTVINVGSGAADAVPPVPGGFAFSYGANKAAFHRLAPFLHLEYRPERVRAFTLDPGPVRTERFVERVGDMPGSVAPDVPAAVIRWLALDADADAHLGGDVHAPSIAKKKGWLT